MTKPVTFDLEQGHTLLLKGPAWIRAKRGDAQCFGAPIQSDDWTMIEESRQEPIYAADNTLLEDRKSTRLNSSHLVISYAVFCLKKKKKNTTYKCVKKRMRA